MKIPYIMFMKHAEKITKNAPSGRPVLKGVHHTEDGNLVVTDSHRLYLAKNATHGNEPTVLDPKTGDQIDGNYPPVDRLIPSVSNTIAEILFDTKDLLSGVSALLKCNQVASGEKAFVKLNANSGSLPTITIKNSLMFSQFTGGQFNGDEDVKLIIDTQYFVDALSLFKACKTDKIILRYYGSFRPFTISPEDSQDLLALILPIRIEGSDE
ncbi:hypothetical protein [Bacillus velezensis]|uniref:hypothetical protein n=1 Tax=Bacillus velezensis TaxID=492670 RepID=UPI000955AA52|nr:hypothetical protein [Bacillus velezensis]SIR92690.1 DNA polymerase III beta subunit, C-terminal domain [Bacillus velezensis]